MQSALDAGWITALKNLPSAGGTTVTLASGEQFKLQASGPIDLTGKNAQVEGIVPGLKWRIKTSDGRQFFIEKVTLLDGTAAYMVRGEARTYELAPRSLAIEIVGGLKIVNPDTLDEPEADRETWFSMGGGFYLRITPTRFEFFITADASVDPLGLHGRITGLLVIQSVKSNPNDDNGASRASPACSRSRSPPAPAPTSPTTGLGAITGLFQFTGRVQVMFNTTLEEQVFEVPEAFRNVLPDDYPTEIKIFESAPSIDGTTEEDPTSDGGIYLSALIAGSVKLFDTSRWRASSRSPARSRATVCRPTSASRARSRRRSRASARSRARSTSASTATTTAGRRRRSAARRCRCTPAARSRG